jgi:O-acetyl-ADP-ribose deacetylase (regulator of RNase III)
MEYNFICGNITRQNYDIIVSSASFDGTIGSGVEGDIHTAAGQEMTNEYEAKFKKVTKIAFDTLIKTSGGKLCKTIYHVYAPNYNTANYKEILKKIYLKILNECKNDSKILKSHLINNQIKIGIPILGSGKNKIPVKESAAILETILLEKKENLTLDIDIVFYFIRDYHLFKYKADMSTKNIINYESFVVSAPEISRIKVCNEATEGIIQNIYLPKNGCIIVDLK